MPSTSPNKIKVGLFGSNGHQIQALLQDHPLAQAAAVAGWGNDELPESLQHQSVQQYASLEELLRDDSLQLISLCSPKRSEQAQHAIAAMRAGKHVYAEKPCALTVAEVDEIEQVANQTGCIFHEQHGAVLTEPYATMREIIDAGHIGQVIQVYAQKSYPWYDGRPQDEALDGGLALQVGVYIARFVEHVANMRIKDVTLQETRLGNPESEGDCRRAASFLMQLENGGLATGVANYLGLTQPDWHGWGYETLRIWGDQGFVESIDHGRITTLARQGQPPQPLELKQARPDFFTLFCNEIQDGRRHVPFDLHQELRPTRCVVQAKQQLAK